MKVGQNVVVMSRPMNSSIVIHSLEALRPEATSFLPTVPIEVQQRRARTQTVGQPDEVYPRSPGQIDKRH